MLVGSNDNIIWYNIDYKNLTTKPELNSVSTYNILNNNLYFSNYRLIINKTFNSTTSSIKLLNLVGLYTTFNYTLTIDRNKSYNIILNNIQDNAKYTLETTSDNTNKGVINLENNTIKAMNSGVATITATINSTNKYLESTSIPIVITVIKANQASIIKNPIAPLYYKGTTIIDLSGGTIDNPITLNINNKTINNCSLSGNIVSGLKAGDCNVTATKTGDYQFNSQNLELKLQVLKLPQPKMTIKLDDISGNITGDITLNVNRSASYNLMLFGQLENPDIKWEVIVNYSIDPKEPVCKIINNKLIPYNSGVCLVQANVDETDNYLSGQSDPILVTVVKNIQTPLTYDLKQLSYADNTIINVNGGSSSSQVNLSVMPDSTNICSINGNRVKALNTGNCNLMAIKEGDIVWDTIKMKIPLIVNKRNQDTMNVNIM
jgi:hypothetical protein